MARPATPGDLVAQRFALERLAGTGGMGAVYRAEDRVGGGVVAIKVLHAHAAHDVDRFAREAEVLAGLRHPNIVRYVAHGATAEGDRYLAMEWLDGESLADRLKHQPLTVAEAVTLGGAVAEALAIAHRAGVVHRDLKPSNLFLVGGSVGRVKVIDFGIARVRDTRRQLTMTGATLGTPGYMAPEQARGDPVDARADVFALGCVLFKCLTGRSPFVGDDALAVLLKVVLEQAPRPSELRSEIPPDLDDLLAHMLAKSAADRPADGEAVATAIATLGSVWSGGAPRMSAVPALTESEQRVMCVVLARGRELDPEAITVTTGASEDRDRGVSALAARHGATYARLADGSVVLTVSTAEAATDLAARAARCALAVRPLLEGAPMALVVGRGVPGERIPVGAIIDEAVRLVAGDRRRADRAARIHLDDAAAALLEARFAVLGDDPERYLAGERDVDAGRTLLGRPTPCVGRDRELRSLEAMLDECASEPLSRAVVVTGGAGVGKSRLRHELLRRLEGHEGAPEILVSRGDPMSAGAPFAMLGPAIRRAAGVLDGEPLEVRQGKLRARVARHVRGADLARVTEFIGELVGIPFPDDDSVELRSARKDPRVLGDQMRRAFEDLLAAECAARPVLLVLEDLHWGDPPTVAFVDSALRNLADRPLMVLALARPEVAQLFPNLWAGRRVDLLHLMPLTRKGSERLVREVLGPDLAADTLERIVDRAGGNAFYLEELIRAVAEGKGDELPDTVLAMTQARLERLDSEARRILRAASVFGQVFWPGGVRALLGGAERTLELPDWLAELGARELVTRRAQARFPMEEEYTFRHAMVREAAYAMLTDADRALGHRLAGDWLEAAGESEAVVLAEHFERGGERSRAAGWYRRAAEQALRAGDLEAALGRAERGFACGAGGEDRGVLLLVAAEAHGWRGDNADAQRRGLEAMESLERGGADWFSAAAEVASAAGRLAHADVLSHVGDALLGADPSADASAPHALALARAALHSTQAGLDELAQRLLARAGAEGGALVPVDPAAPPGAAANDPAVRGWILRALGTRASYLGDPATHAELSATSAAEFERAGDLRSACVQRVNLGYANLELGNHAAAGEILATALAAAERMGLTNLANVAKNNLGLSLARTGDVARGLAVEREAVEAFRAQGERRMEGGSRIYLALILLCAGDAAGAEREARAAAEVLVTTPPAYPFALGTLADVLLTQGRAPEALAASAEGMERLEALGGMMEEGESLLRLAHARALAATGRPAEARAAIEAARARLLERAARMGEPQWRESFLAAVPENARTLELAAAWERGEPRP